MKLLPMAELLERAAARGYAVPSFCVWNLEMAQTALRTAEELRAPVILMSGPGEFPLVRPAELSMAVHGLAEHFSVPSALHLDHGGSLADVEECLAAGFTSVMLDYSDRPFAENVAALRQVVEMAHPRGVTVEGEIGHVGSVDPVAVEGAIVSTLTDPEEAAAYVAETGVDALAVSIGNAHGHYPQLPRLDLERLARIRERTTVPLVLHGGSGTPEGELRQAISRGIAKVNVASDLITGVRESLLDQWNAGRNLWTPTAMAQAMEAVAEVVAGWIRRTGAAGQA
jgi:ketose-bisphosphate aldolase